LASEQRVAQKVKIDIKRITKRENSKWAANKVAFEERAEMRSGIKGGGCGISGD